MPPKRVDDREGHAHFVTFSCYRRRRHLDHDRGKRIVLGVLDSQLSLQEGRCVGFVVMPDHVHAIVWFPAADQLSHFMKQWKQRSSVQIKRLWREGLASYSGTFDPSGPVWQPRYYDFNLYAPRKIEEKLISMHLNPVRAGSGGATVRLALEFGPILRAGPDGRGARRLARLKPLVAPRPGQRVVRATLRERSLFRLSRRSRQPRLSSGRSRRPRRSRRRTSRSPRAGQDVGVGVAQDGQLRPRDHPVAQQVPLEQGVEQLAVEGDRVGVPDARGTSRRSGCRRRVADDPVGAGAADQEILAAAADDHVVAVAAQDDVRATAAVQVVLAAAAVDHGRQVDVTGDGRLVVAVAEDDHHRRDPRGQHVAIGAGQEVGVDPVHAVPRG